MKSLLFICLILAIAYSHEYKEEDNVLVLDRKSFDKAIVQYPYIMVEFYSPDCGHCKNLEPIYAEAAGILKDSHIPLAKVDATDEKILSAKYKVRSYPTIIFFRGGLRQDYTGPRSADGIANWIHLNARPLIQIIETEVDLKQTIQNNNNVLVYFEKVGEEPLNLKSQQILADLSFKHKNLKICIVRQPQLREVQNVQDGDNFVFYNKVQVSTYSGLFDQTLLQEYLHSELFPLVFTYAPELMEDIQNQGLPVVFLWNTAETEHFRGDFEELAQQNKGKFQFAIVQSSNPEGELKFIEEMNVQGLESGWIYLKDYRSQFKYKLHGKELTVAAVTEWLSAFQIGTLERLQPPTHDGNVRIITSENFNQLVRNSPQDVLLEFYAPWCGHCQQLAPVYEQLAEKLQANPNILIAKIDGTQNQIPGITIEGFPTIKFFKKGASPATQDYEEQRDLNSFFSFLQDQTSHQWVNIEGQPIKETPVKLAKVEQIKTDQVTIVTVENYADVVLNSQQDVLLEFYAPWCGHCQHLTPIYDELAKTVSGNPNIIIAKVDATAHKLPGVEIRGYPTLKFFKKGGQPTVIDYQGGRDVQSFLNFIETNKGTHVQQNDPVEGSKTVESVPQVEVEVEVVEQAKEAEVAEEVPSFKSELVTIVTLENFEQVVRNSKEDVLLEFYAPWCGHCKKLAPIYDELALKLRSNPNIIIAKVDMDANKLPEMGIKGFPTIKLFRKGDNETIVDYKDARTVQAFLKFLKSNTR